MPVVRKTITIDMGEYGKYDVVPNMAFLQRVEDSQLGLSMTTVRSYSRLTEHAWVVYSALSVNDHKVDYDTVLQWGMDNTEKLVDASLGLAMEILHPEAAKNMIPLQEGND